MSRLPHRPVPKVSQPEPTNTYLRIQTVRRPKYLLSPSSTPSSFLFVPLRIYCSFILALPLSHFYSLSPSHTLYLFIALSPSYTLSLNFFRIIGISLPLLLLRSLTRFLFGSISLSFDFISSSSLVWSLTSLLARTLFSGRLCSLSLSFFSLLLALVDLLTSFAPMPSPRPYALDPGLPFDLSVGV